MQWIRGLPLRFKIAAVGGVVLLLMLAAVGVMQVSLTMLTNVNRQGAAVFDTNYKIEHLRHLVSDTESSVRGYAITRDSELLAPYHDGIAAIPFALDDLQRVLPADANHVAKIARLRALVQYWTNDGLTPAVEKAAAGQPATDMVAAGVGKAAMEQVIVVLQELEAEEGQNIQALLKRSDSAALLGERAVPAAVAVAVALSLYGVVALARHIVQPIKELKVAVDTVATGHFGHTLPVSSQDEIGRLTVRFNDMSRALLAHQEETAAQNEELQEQQAELSAQNEELMTQEEQLNAAMAELERDHRRVQQLNQSASELANLPDVHSLAEQLLARLLVAGRAQVGAIALMLPSGDTRIEAHVGLTDEAAGITRSVGFLRQSAGTGDPFAISYPHGELLRPVYHTAIPVAHELYLPIRSGSETLAVAILGRTDDKPFAEKDINWLGLMASQAAAFFTNRLAYNKLQVAFSDLQDSTAQVEELTAQIEAERDQVSIERDNMDAILKTTSEGFWLIDNQGTTLRQNEQFWKLTGIPRDANMELLDSDRKRLIEEQLKNPEVVSAMWETLAAEPEAVLHHLLHFVDGRVLHRYTAPVYGRDGRQLGRLFVLRDVTRESEIDHMKTEFIATVSHELRTPLTSIRGYVDLILDGDVGPVPDQQRQFLSLVSRSTVRLAQLIDDLLDVEKIENGRIEMRQELVDVGKLLAEVVDTFRISAGEKGLTCEIALQEPLPLVPGDAGQITQALTNLLSNAIKYTDQGGVAVAAHATGDDVTITVSDTGIGIAPEDLPKLFTKFFRADNQYTRKVGGTGLGLALTRAIVERHDGEITVQTDPGRGSTFVVTLPVAVSISTAADRV